MKRTALTLEVQRLLEDHRLLHNINKKISVQAWEKYQNIRHNLRNLRQPWAQEKSLKDLLMRWDN